MRETDAMLLESLAPGPTGPVALLPTASALEPGKPEEWNARGVAHFSALGATPTPLLLLSRDDAESDELAVELSRHRFFYFSGGNPDYLVETLRGTPSWLALRKAHRRGAVLAGCSAGAMMLGGALLSVRGLREGLASPWRTGLGLLPGLVVLPHFDRLRYWLTDDRFRETLATAPADATVVGVDEDTALVFLPSRADGVGEWIVTGRQAVTVFDATGAGTRYAAGASVPLAPPQGGEYDREAIPTFDSSPCPG
jgi:cyanophycinase